MSESLEIIYFGKGFSKGKNGGQKPMTGMTIGRGAPVPALMSALSMLRASSETFAEEIDEAYLKWTVHNEVENFKRKF